MTLPLSFRGDLGIVSGKFVPRGLHGISSAEVSASSLSSHPSAIFERGGTCAVLHLLDVPREGEEGEGGGGGGGLILLSQCSLLQVRSVSLVSDMPHRRS